MLSTESMKYKVTNEEIYKGTYFLEQIQIINLIEIFL